MQGVPLGYHGDGVAGGTSTEISECSQGRYSDIRAREDNTIVRFFTESTVYNLPLRHHAACEEEISGYSKLQRPLAKNVQRVDTAMFVCDGIQQSRRLQESGPQLSDSSHLMPALYALSEGIAMLEG